MISHSWCVTTAKVRFFWPSAALFVVKNALIVGLLFHSLTFTSYYDTKNH